MKKKLFILIPTLGTGGGEKLVVDLARTINKEKFDVTIICLFSKKNSIYESLIKNQNIKTIYMNKKLGMDFKIIFKLIKLFNAEKPDIVHTHLNVMQFVLPAIIFSRVKVRIHTVHSIAQKESEGILRKIMYFSYKFFKVKPVAICDVVKHTIMEVYNLKESKISCIYNGVDNKIFYINKNKEINTSTIRFITTGTLYEVKNHKLLIDAFAEIVKINTNINLTILGDGELRSNLEDQIRQYSLEDKIELKGIVKDVAKELNNADVYVITSNYEGLPLSVLEAMACGLPIIATRAGGIVDIVKNNKNGILIDINNKKQLINAMDILINNENLRNKMGTESYEFSKEYTIKSMTNKYEKLYVE